MEAKEKMIENLPFDYSAVEQVCGEIRDISVMCPGVYYLFVVKDKDSHISTECYLVLPESPAITQQARTYGTPVPAAPDLLLYEYQDYTTAGWHIVDYEIHKYLSDNGLPLPETTSLLSDRVFGMEICPEYFGEFPAPEEPPWGKPIERVQFWNGVYGMRTEAVGWVLAVCYPFCCDLPEDVLEAAELLPEDREQGIDKTLGYRFLYKPSTNLPIAP